MGRFRGFSGAPLITPWPTPDRGFLAPAEAVSPVRSGFMFLACGATTSTYCSLELSIEIFAYLWDKEFIWMKLPLSPGGEP